MAKDNEEVIALGGVTVNTISCGHRSCGPNDTEGGNSLAKALFEFGGGVRQEYVTVAKK